MQTNDNKQVKPFVRIVKKDDMPSIKKIPIYVIAIILAVMLSGLILFVLTGSTPINIYKTMIYGALGSERKIWVTTRETMFLLGVAMALTLAYKMKFWNIGGEGQILVGGISTAAIMIYFGDYLPTSLLFILMVMASLLSGMLWGIVPAFFKANWQTNETLFTLMLNYIALQLTSFFTIVWEAVEGSGSIGVINSDSKAGWLSTSFMSELFGSYNFMISVIIVLLLSALVHIYLKCTKQGYEIAVVGESENTAKYVGIDVKKVVIRTMALSGAICGFIGFLIVSSSSHTISTSTANDRGFTAIIVAWLANFNPIIMLLISFFLIFMDQGATQIASDYNLNESASDVITGIILFIILASTFFTKYGFVFRMQEREEK